MRLPRTRTLRSEQAGLAPCYALEGCGSEAADAMTCASVSVTAPTIYQCPGYRLPNEAENSGNTTHPVGQKVPNGWGLFDVLGNSGEWVNDTFTGLGYGNDPLTDP